MNLGNFITSLEKQQIQVRLVDGQLQVYAPNNTLSPDLIQELKERKEEIIAFLHKVSSRKPVDKIPALPPAADYEVSHAQKRLWLLDQLGVKSAYNVSIGYEFEGLDPQVFAQAFAILVARHEVLRTRFVTTAGEPRQIIIPSEEFAFEVAYQKSCETVALDFLVNSAAVPFNLESGPLLRVDLLEVSANRYWCLICLHHIITDGWSMDVMLEELTTCYNGLKKGEEVLLPELRIQYKDFAAWQNQQLISGALAEDKKYWEEKFATRPTVWEFPFSKNRPKTKNYDGNTIFVNIDRAKEGFLDRLGAKYNASKFMVFFATIKALIYKYTNVEDLTLGSVFADRLTAELHHQLGFYVNTLALRTQFSKQDKFVDFLLKVKEVSLDSYRYQGYPFDCLIDQLDIERDRGRHPLFDVMVLFENEMHSPATRSLQDVSLNRLLPEVETTSKYDMTFTFIQSKEGIRLKIEYNKALFDLSSIERMTIHYKTLLDSIQQNEQTPLSELNFLPEEERIQLLTTFNNTATFFPEDKTFHALFEERALTNPDNIALVFKDHALSYGELNAKANQLAHYLINSHGAKKGDHIGIKVSRSEQMIIGLFGILKAGCAYVPIATNTPEKRVDYILEDAEIKVLLTDENREGFCKWLNLEEVIKGQTNLPMQNPGVSMSSEDLAYIIYTSGSTGMPKGVMVPHIGVVNRVYWMWKKYKFNTTSAILQKTSYTFDVSVGEIFTALCFGARLVLCPEEKVYDPLALVEEIERNEITSVHFVPSMFNVFLDAFEAQWTERLSSLENVFASGEALLPETVKKYYSYLDVPLHNLYGPTEASVEVTYYATNPSDTVIPIGRPISNIRMYVLGERDELVPVETWGEICIAGVGLAYGYINKEILSKERFIPNPYEPGKLLYRTGDIGRWLPDGNIEYKGRKDFQVKIRGFRIELGEIENILLGYEGIEHVVAIVDGEAESKKIVAYYSGKGEVSLDNLDRFVKKHLPDYMVPAQYMYLDTIPLTDSGKVDRKALPKPTNQENQDLYVSPSNETERILVNIWQQVLQVEKLSTAANFFGLGGHSLLGIQMLTRIHKVFDLKLELQEILEYPTIIELAAHIQRLKWILESQNSENRQTAGQIII